MKKYSAVFTAIILCACISACQNEATVTPSPEISGKLEAQASLVASYPQAAQAVNIQANTDLLSLVGQPFGYFNKTFGWKLSDLEVFQEGPPVGEYILDNVTYVFNNYLGYDPLTNESPCTTINVRYTDLFSGLENGALTEDTLVSLFGQPVDEIENGKIYRSSDADMAFKTDNNGKYEDIVRVSYAFPLSLYEPRSAKNPSYTLFYGEWEATERIYADRMPTRGTYYDNDELESAKKYYLENNRLRTIQFTSDNVVVNGDTVNDIQYDCRVFPANDDYLLHFTMTLSDIGLTEAQGNYFVFVEVNSAPGVLSGNREFFVKDENTLIFYKGDHCIEYTRTSYDGGSKEPTIIYG